MQFILIEIINKLGYNNNSYYVKGGIVMIHLNIKSCYSFFNSALSVEEIVNNAIKHKENYVCILDKNVMFSFYELDELCKKNNLVPLYGVEIQVNYNDNIHSLALIAQNDLGYKNLCRLSNLVSKPRNNIVTFEQLKELGEGVVAIIPSLVGAFNNEERLSEIYFNNYIYNLKSIFAGVYLGMELDFDKNRVNRLRELANKFELPRIYFHEVKCGKKSDIATLNVLNAIKNGVKLTEIDTKHNNCFYLSESDIVNFFDEEEIGNVAKLAVSCKVNLDNHKSSLPSFPLDKEKGNKNDYLVALCKKGLEKRLNGKVTQNYINRLMFELNIIRKMGFTDYFLIVYDYILFAKKNKILVGPGRGSAAASLVAYSLGITEIDPLKFNLFFERFLNPERVTMPDIDVDFLDTRREEIIEYLKDKYGFERVSHVLALSTLKVKQALRDVCKVYGLSSYEVDSFLKSVPDSMRNSTLQEIYETNSTFRNYVNSRDIYQQIFASAKKIEGLPRQTTLHAAGIVLSQEPLYNTIPVYYQDENTLVTSMDMLKLERTGLLKMDLLALKNLSIIQNCLDNIYKFENPNFNLKIIDYEDKKVYSDLINFGAYGVFQFESSGMQKVIKLIKPNCFMDLVAILALFRPGPMAQIDVYERRKHGKEPVTYLHADLEAVLKETYGIIVYQEQIMQILQIMAGFTLGKADLVRRAIGKKELDKLKSIEDDFINGAVNKRYSRDLAKEVFNLIVKFADYGFNKAHSVSYTDLAYQMAYLKSYYPLSFYCGILNMFKGNISKDEKFNDYFTSAKKQGIKFLPPSVNHSQEDFTIFDSSIIFPLTSIKGINISFAQALIKERNKKPFENLLDFVARTISIGGNEEIYTNLIMAGALDCFNYNKQTMLSNLSSIVRFCNLITYGLGEDIVIDYSLAPRPEIKEQKANLMDSLMMEKEVMGLLVSPLPLAKLRKQLENAKYISILDCFTKKERYDVKIMGYLTNIHEFKTKKGDDMATLTLIDETSSIEVTLFKEAYSQLKNILKTNRFYTIKGFMQFNPRVNIVASKVIFEERMEELING